MISALIIQTFAWVGAMGMALFLAAGTLNWAGAWIWLGEVIVIFLVGGLWLAWHDPVLLKERLAPPISEGSAERRQDPAQSLYFDNFRCTCPDGPRCRPLSMVAGSDLGAGDRQCNFDFIGLDLSPNNAREHLRCARRQNPRGPRAYRDCHRPLSACPPSHVCGDHWFSFRHILAAGFLVGTLLRCYFFSSCSASVFKLRNGPLGSDWRGTTITRRTFATG